VVGESAGAIGRLAALPRPAPRHDVPRLVVAGGHDPCGRPVELERLAAEIGADYQCHPDADHALPFGPLWETVAAGVHRWLIRTLGESLLLLRGDEDLREE
jgi:alpha-beta hydrolase superfamily lysophospholipase